MIKVFKDWKEKRVREGEQAYRRQVREELLGGEVDHRQEQLEDRLESIVRKRTQIEERRAEEGR